MVQVVQINPRILSWARETAGLSLEEAAAKLGLTTTSRASAEEKLSQAEQGMRPISSNMLQKAAVTYRRPLVTFYLPQPPRRGERGEDFRTVSSAPSSRDDATLDALIRDVRVRQQLLREVLLDDEATRPLEFVASSKTSDGARAVAVRIRSALGVDATEQKSAKGSAALFNLLRVSAERIGIFVLLLGDLGSHHSDIDEEAFRGFALADSVAPFVIINDNDAQPARAFTLLHELAHIWLGATGVSGPLRGVSPNIIEQFCNEVAGDFLLPSEAVTTVAPADGSQFDLAAALSLSRDIAQAWNISQGVIAYRFLSNGWVSASVAATMFRSFAERWKTERVRARESRTSDDSGPDYYVVRRARLGRGLIDTVRRALHDDVVTHTKAARILGVKPTSVDSLLRERRHA